MPCSQAFRAEKSLANYETLSSWELERVFQEVDERFELDRLKHAALQYIGPEPIPWSFSYRVKLGIK